MELFGLCGKAVRMKGLAEKQRKCTEQEENVVAGWNRVYKGALPYWDL